MFDDLRSIFKKNGTGSQDSQSRYEKDMLSLNPTPPNTKIIAIVNQKGGCGKTTTCINLSAGLVKRGLKVLVVDLDPQAHSSLGLGIDVYTLSTSLYDVIVKSKELDQVILSTYLRGLDIAPSTSLLTGAQLEIADLLGRESLLKTNIWRMLNTNIRKYDYVIMDCSPSLNLITINGLVAAQSLLVPIQAHYFSLEGMRELLTTIRTVKERINAELDVLGILPTIFDSRTKMSRDVLSQLREYFGPKLLKSIIRMNIKLADASAHGQSIFDYDPSSNGAKDYNFLVNEVLSLTRPELASPMPEEAEPVSSEVPESSE